MSFNSSITLLADFKIHAEAAIHELNVPKQADSLSASLPGQQPGRLTRQTSNRDNKVNERPFTALFEEEQLKGLI